MGHSCQLGFHDDSGAGQWWRLSEGNPYTPPRTGSAGVYLSSTGAMYLFGGKTDIYLISTDVVLISNGKKRPPNRLAIIHLLDNILSSEITAINNISHFTTLWH